MITKCRLGDLNIQFDLIYDRTVKHLEPYLLDFDTPDLKLELTQQNFDFERKVVKEACNISYHNKTLEPTVAYRVLAEKLPLFDAAVFHSCAFKVNDRGIALAAKSGTGKSTHMFLWQKLLGEKFQIINGDKPILRLVDGKPYIYGTPWAGKEKLCANIKSPLTDVCRIVRSKTNVTKPMTKDEGIRLLMEQIYIPFNVETRLMAIESIYKVADEVNFWEINCNMEIEAAQTAINTILNA